MSKKDIWDELFYITPSRKKKLSTVKKNTWTDLSIVFEDISDPHNVLASFRNCDAFGVRDIHLIFNTTPKFNPKDLGRRSSASANKWVNVKTWDNTKECFDFLNKNKKEIYATYLNSKATNIWDFNFKQNNLALVFGNEKKGVSKYVLDNVKGSIYIPMFGFVQSLNLSVSVGIVLYELNRQRRVGNK